MSTAATEVGRKAPRAQTRGTGPARALDRSTRQAIHEATTVGCGANLRHAMIAEAAYYRAERRGFEPGRELEDWLAAEGDIQCLWTRVFEEGPLVCGE
jgi:hypothetical protein